MKLTKEHKEILKSFGHEEEDFAQIERATLRKNLDLFLCEEGKPKKRIGVKTAIELLGIREFLSGLSRSAFHWTSARDVNDKQYVDFSNYKMFRRDL